MLPLVERPGWTNHPPVVGSSPTRPTTSKSLSCAPDLRGYRIVVITARRADARLTVRPQIRALQAGVPPLNTCLQLTLSEYGSRATSRRQSASSARLRGPQLRSAVHLVSSPTVTKEMHPVCPVRRAGTGQAHGRAGWPTPRRYRVRRSSRHAGTPGAVRQSADRLGRDHATYSGALTSGDTGYS
jgi:hypothetical protein